MSFYPGKALKIIFSFTVLLFVSLNYTVFSQLPNVYQQVTTVGADVPVDMDGDGMPNWWELLYGLDPTDPTDAGLDPDGDGLTNLVEYTHLTNPLNRDTDGGGVWDDLEIRLNKNPLDPSDDFDPITFRAQPEEPNDPRGDSDGDGISNTDEDKYGTNKHSVDTDDDGVNDHDELFKYLTNPLEPDTDFDGVGDYDEIFTYFTDPNNRDTDFDGLIDSEELFTYKTNPAIWDTDSGGMSDYDEVINGSNPLFMEDDYQFTWLIYFGNEPNDIFKSLQQSKINIYQGMNLTLEAVKPAEVKDIKIQYNDEEFTTEKSLIKLKLLSPNEPGIYQIELVLNLRNGNIVRMTRFVELKQKGKIVRRIDGKFNNLYSKIDFFDNQIVPDSKIQVFTYNEISGDLELFRSNIFPIANPQYSDAQGTYVLALHPGNYLIKISKPEFGDKEILFNTDRYTLYSQDIYLSYNYDLLVWGTIFISVFGFVWFLISFIEFLRMWLNKLLEQLTAKKAY